MNQKAYTWPIICNYLLETEGILKVIGSRIHCKRPKVSFCMVSGNHDAIPYRSQYYYCREKRILQTHIINNTRETIKQIDLELPLMSKMLTHEAC